MLGSSDLCGCRAYDQTGAAVVVVQDENKGILTFAKAGAAAIAGRFIDATTVTYNNLTGKINADGTKIDWGSGTIYTKKIN